MIPVPFNTFTRRYAAQQGELLAATERVLASGRYLLGPELEALEEQVAAMAGVRYAVGVGSGTDALKMALRAAGVAAGDEVVTVANTAIPTAAAIVELGAVPVFAEIEPESMTMDPDGLAAALTERTRAVVPVDLYGQCAAYEPIMEIARRHGVPVIADACQSFGASRNGRAAGAWGEAGCISFYPTKNLGAFGDGGMVLTGRADLAEKVRCLRNCGQVERYRAAEAGYNSRLDELQAALLRVKLPHLAADNARRRALAARYAGLLADGPVRVPAAAAGNEHIFHLFAVRHPRRDELQRYLHAHGVETLIHYPLPLYRQPAFARYARAPLAHTEQACAGVLSLPLTPEITDVEVAQVAALLAAFA